MAGRHLLQNVIDLDPAARCSGVAENSADLPMLLFFDFSAAFPSVALAWIWVVIEAMDVLPGLKSLLEGVYFMNCTLLGGALGVPFLRGLCWSAPRLPAQWFNFCLDS